MKPIILIDDAEAELYRDVLQPLLPGLKMRTGRSREEMFAALPDAHVVITFGYHFDAEAVGQAPDLQWLQALSSGTDHLQRALADRPEVVLTSMRGVHAQPVAEHALMLMLALSRGFPAMLDAQRQHRWHRASGDLLAGKVVGIAGMGLIGEAIARRCRAFEMRTIGFGSAPRENDTVEMVAAYADMPRLLPDIDILVNVAPSNAATEGMFDRKFFAAMKPESLVVNVGRGSTLVEADLITALTNGHIAGAALDVFAQEPLPEISPLWDMPNVIVTPHVAGAHGGYFDSTIAILRENLSAYAEGAFDRMRNRVC